MSWQPSIELQITTSLPWQRSSVFCNYHNRPPTGSPREGTSSRPFCCDLQSTLRTKATYLTTLISSGVYTQPVKGGYGLASCYSSYPTLNLGEGQTSPSRKRQVYVVVGLAGTSWRSRACLHKIDNLLLNKAPQWIQKHTHVTREVLGERSVRYFCSMVLFLTGWRRWITGSWTSRGDMSWPSVCVMVHVLFVSMATATWLCPLIAR